MTPVVPPPPPAGGYRPTPLQLLGAAQAVLTNEEPVLDGRRSITAAALARQSLENLLYGWLEANDAGGRSSAREAFVCLAALHPDRDLALELHETWAQLSGACHAISYDLPPTHSELERWIAVIQRFATTAPMT